MTKHSEKRRSESERKRYTDATASGRPRFPNPSLLKKSPPRHRTVECIKKCSPALLRGESYRKSTPEGWYASKNKQPHKKGHHSSQKIRILTRAYNQQITRKHSHNQHSLLFLRFDFTKGLIFGIRARRGQNSK